MMLDHQRRDDDTGFQQNGDTGKRVHGMLGWDKYDGKVEFLTELFPSSGTGQVNAVFPLPA